VRCPDAGVRGQAALALGTRAVAEAIPALIDMIIAGRNDTEAADVKVATRGRGRRAPAPMVSGS